jgi:hypothetical protein
MLKSWQNSTDTNYSQKNFGRWPQDILTRCLCIIALDRFGDYSGAMIKSSKHDKNEYQLCSTNFGGNIDVNSGSDGVIEGAVVSAPVREVAARVLSMLIDVSPRAEIQKPTYQILVRLASYEQEWEVRQGAMLAFKYVTGLMSKRDNKTIDKIWNGVVSHAIEGLKDDSDDVRSASAQVLCHFVHYYNNEDEGLTKTNISRVISMCATKVWIAMKQVHNMSSCTLDLLNLFSQLISTDCQSVLDSIGILDHETSQSTIDQLLKKMNDFLNFDDASVKLSCFCTLSVIAGPIATVLIRTRKRDNHTACNRAIQLYCNLLLNIFNSFSWCTGSSIIGNENDEMDKNTQSKADLFNSTRNNTWAAIVNTLCRLIQDDDILVVRPTFLALLLRLVNIESSQMHGLHGSATDGSMERYNIKSKISAHYQCLITSCNAFADLYKKICLGSTFDELLAIFIFCLLESPWHELCESGCILLKSLYQQTEIHHPNSLLLEYQRVLLKILDRDPNCTYLDSYSNVGLVRMDKSVQEMCNKTLVAMLEAEAKEDSATSNNEIINWIRDRVNQVVHVWDNTFQAFNINFVGDATDLPKIKRSKHHMRLSASIAGTSLSLGPHYLPSKLTHLIRALMTSIKNKWESLRSQITCKDLAYMIQLLNQSNTPRRNVVADKILQNVCSMASCDPKYCDLPNGFTPCGWKAAQCILRLLIKAIPKNEDLASISILWQWIVCLKSSDPALIEDTNLEKAITIFSDISFALKKETKVYEQVVSLLLPTLVVLACTYTKTYFRQKSLDAITNTCMVDPETSIPVVLPILFPYLNDNNNDACRLGACIVMNKLFGV